MKYLLWEIAWVNLQLMIVDGPKYDSGEKDTTIEEPDEIEEIKQLLKL